jgi:hypothetical protein
MTETSMQCTEFERVLEQDLDGSLPLAAASHLEACPDCRLLWDDIQTIRQVGQELGTDEPEVPGHIWTALRARLESEGLVRGGQSRGWLAGWFGRAPRLVLAGAYAAVLLVAVTLVSYNMDRVPEALSAGRSGGANVTVAPRMADLDSTLDGNIERVMASLPQRDVELTDSFRQNLGIVDNLIAVCEKSVREQPDDALARDYLYGAYQQKAVLLATAMDRSTLEGR